MNSETEAIRELLAHMGIAAEVKDDEGSEKMLIIIENEQFNRRRAWVETWFTLIEQDGRYSYLRERPRGTGQTV